MSEGVAIMASRTVVPHDISSSSSASGTWWAPTLRILSTKSHRMTAGRVYVVAPGGKRPAQPTTVSATPPPPPPSSQPASLVSKLTVLDSDIRPFSAKLWYLQVQTTFFPRREGLLTKRVQDAACHPFDVETLDHNTHHSQHVTRSNTLLLLQRPRARTCSVVMSPPPPAHERSTRRWCWLRTISLYLVSTNLENGSTKK